MPYIPNGALPSHMLLPSPYLEVTTILPSVLIIPQGWLFFFFLLGLSLVFPDGSVSKESTYNAGDIVNTGSITEWGRSPGGGNGSPLQYSCLKNPLDREAWQVTVHGVARVGHD